MLERTEKCVYWSAGSRSELTKVVVSAAVVPPMADFPNLFRTAEELEEDWGGWHFGPGRTLW